MENNVMYIPLWIKIIMVVICVGMLVLVAMWSIVWDWIWGRSKALSKKMLSAAARCSTRIVFVATNNAAKLGHYMNRHFHIRPRHA